MMRKSGRHYFFWYACSYVMALFYGFLSLLLEGGGGDSAGPRTPPPLRGPRPTVSGGG